MGTATRPSLGASVSRDEKLARLAELLRRRAAGPRTAPLSPAQGRLWFVSQADPASPAYHVPAALRLAGPVDLPALRQALAGLVQRHEALRTRFVTTGDRPEQVIDPAGALDPEVVDLGPAADREAALAAACRAFARRPFDLAAGPPARAALFRLADDDHVLLVVAHHLVCDGWSLAVLWNDLAALYAAARAGAADPLPPLPIRYTDFADWDRDRLAREWPGLLAYWRDRLAGLPPVLDLPADRPRPPAPSHAGGTVPVAVPADLAERLRAVGRREGVTPFMVLLAALKVLLYRHTGQPDLAVGAPAAGRPRAETEGLVGLFINTLVFRTGVAEDLSVRGLLRAVRDTALGALAHEAAPFDRLVAELRPARSAAHPPLFQVMFALQNGPPAPRRVGDLAARPYPVHTGTAKFDLTLELEDRDGGFGGYLEYNADLFDRATAAGLAGRFRAVLEGLAAADPEAPAAGLLDGPAATPAPRPVRRAAAEAAAPDVPPAPAEVEAALAGVWAEVLGVAPGPDDNFFDLGGHSLLALRLVGRIEARFGRRLRVDALLAHPTVRSLARVVAGAIGDGCWATLRLVQAGSPARPPLFCVASPRAEMLGYGVLARHLGPDQPVYVLQGQYRGEEDAPYTVAEYEAMAAEYLRAVRAARPRGPYHLAGMCQGAHIAFEMARRLHAAGEDVPLLAVLDAWPEENTRRRLVSKADYYYRRAKAGLGRLFRAGRPADPTAPAPADLTRNVPASGWAKWQARYWPGRAFVPPTWPGRLTLFRVRRQPLRRVRDPQMGWGSRALGGVDVRVIPGGHTTFLREPHVRELAADLRRRLDPPAVG